MNLNSDNILVFSLIVILIAAVIGWYIWWFFRNRYFEGNGFIPGRRKHPVNALGNPKERDFVSEVSEPKIVTESVKIKKKTIVEPATYSSYVIQSTDPKEISTVVFDELQQEFGPVYEELVHEEYIEEELTEEEKQKIELMKNFDDVANFEKIIELKVRELEEIKKKQDLTESKIEKEVSKVVKNAKNLSNEEQIDAIDQISKVKIAKTTAAKKAATAAKKTK